MKTAADILGFLGASLLAFILWIVCTLVLIALSLMPIALLAATVFIVYELVSMIFNIFL